MTQSNIQMTINLKDGATPELQKFNESLKGLEQQIGKASQQLNKFKEAFSSIDTTKKNNVFEKFGNDLDSITKKAELAGLSIELFGVSANDTKSKVETLKVSVTHLFDAFSMFKGKQQFFTDLNKELDRSVDLVRKLQKAFNGATTDSSKFASHIKEIRKDLGNMVANGERAENRIRGFGEASKNSAEHVASVARSVNSMSEAYQKIRQGDKFKNIISETETGSVIKGQKSVQESLNNTSKAAATGAGEVKKLITQINNVGKALEKPLQSFEKFNIALYNAGREINIFAHNVANAIGVIAQMGSRLGVLSGELRQLGTAAGGTLSNFNALHSNLSNNPLARHSQQVQQVTRDYNDMSRAMVGAVQMWGANKIGGEFKEVIQTGIQTEQQQVRMVNAGLNKDEQLKINSMAEDLHKSGKYSSLSIGELRSTLTDLALESGDIELVEEISKNWAAMANVLKNNAAAAGLNFGSGDLEKFSKAFDIKNSFTNAQNADMLTNLVTKASNYFGPRSITGENTQNLFRYMKGSATKVEEETLMFLLSVQDKNKASTVGLNFDGLLRKSRGIGTQIDEKKAIYEMGLMDDSVNLKKDKHGVIQWDKINDFKVKNYELMQKNLYQWIQEYLIPALTAKGVDLDNALPAISKMWENSGQANLLDAAVTNREQTKKDIAGQRAASDRDPSNEIVSDTAASKVAQFKNEVEALYKTLAALLNPIFKDIVVNISHFIAKLNELAKANPATTSIILLGTAITGLGLAIGGILTWFGGLSSMLLGIRGVLAGVAGAFTGFATIVVRSLMLVVNNLFFLGFMAVPTVYKAVSELINGLASGFEIGFERIVVAIGTIVAGAALFARQIILMGGIAAAGVRGILTAFARGFGLVGVILMMAEPIMNFKVAGTSLIEWAIIITTVIVDVFDSMVSSIAGAIEGMVKWIGSKITGAISSFGGFIGTAAKNLGMDAVAKEFESAKKAWDKMSDSLQKGSSEAPKKAKDDFVARSTARRNEVAGVLAVNSQNSKNEKGVLDQYSEEMNSELNKIKQDIENSSKQAKDDAKRSQEELKAQQALSQAEFAKTQAKIAEDMKAAEAAAAKNNKNGNGNGGAGRKQLSEDANQARNDFKQMESEAKASMDALDSQLKNGLTTYDDYFKKKSELINNSINEEIAALERQKTAYQAAGNIKGVQNVERQIASKRAELDSKIQQLNNEIAGKKKEKGQFELEIEEKLAEVSGNRHESEIAKLDIEMNKLREKAKLMGASPETMSKIDRIEEISRAKIEYAELEKQVKKYGDVSDIAAKKAASAAKLGSITATEASELAAEAYREEGNAIAALIPELERYAQIAGDPAMLKNIEEMKIKSHELANQVSEDARQMKDSMQGNFEGFLNDLSSGKGIKGALKGFADNIHQTISKVLNKQMSEKITNMLFGTQENGKFTGGFGSFFQGIISKDGFNQGGSGGMGGFGGMFSGIGNMFSGLFGGGEQQGGGGMQGLGQAASLATNALTSMTKDGVQASTTALGENIMKTVMGTSVETTATAALTQLASAAQAAAASLSSLGSGGGGGGGLFDMFSNIGGSIFGSFSLPSFDVGADTIPRDMIAQIHKGEMILPASTADKVRNGLSNIGGGSVQNINNFHLSGPTTLQSQQQIASMVGASMNRAIRRNG